MVEIDDLLDARGVAEALRLSHPNTVSVYQHGYEDRPRPVIDLGRPATAVATASRWWRRRPQCRFT